MSDIFSLISYDKCDKSCQYMHAISYDKTQLEWIVEHMHPDELQLRDFVIHENTPVYVFMQLNDQWLLATSHEPFEYNIDNLHAFRKTTTNGAELVLLDSSNTDDFGLLRVSPIFAEYVSDRKVEFDAYYPSGMHKG